MATIKRCDRCGREIGALKTTWLTRRTYYHNLKIDGWQIPQDDMNLDLCPTCGESLKAWAKAGMREEETHGPK